MSDQHSKQQEAFETLYEQIAAVVLDNTATTINSKTASSRALKLHKEITKADVLPIITKLPAESFDGEQLERLRLLGEAAGFVYGRLLDARVLPDASTTKLPKSMVDEATTLKNVMVMVCRYHLNHLKDAKALLDDIERGRGYADLASDLERLAHLYKMYAALLSVDRTHYKADDEGFALRLDSDISAVLTEERESNIRHWTTQQARVLVLLRGVYDDVAATGRWLLRKDEAAAEKRFPSLFVDRLAKKKTAAAPAPDAHSPANETPADMTTSTTDEIPTGV